MSDKGRGMECRVMENQSLEKNGKKLTDNDIKKWSGYCGCEGKAPIKQEDRTLKYLKDGEIQDLERWKMHE